MRSRLKWVNHVERIGDEKLAEIRCSESGGKKEPRKNNNLMAGLQRVGGEWRTIKDKKSWRLLIERVSEKTKKRR